jgi:hypothetical protein
MNPEISNIIELEEYEENPVKEKLIDLLEDDSEEIGGWRLIIPYLAAGYSVFIYIGKGQCELRMSKWEVMKILKSAYQEIFESTRFPEIVDTVSDIDGCFQIRTELLH